ncbi:SPOR domain-containing protein [Candidatus Tisiphia endosymbiont of Hybos culiciformis]|uniref:SPOR domain-containing protein n=1 Tax=Candidatus Tisiphia endosymbiont of Hybos culiciformis TaxID=3139331 RepID=UPI003CCB61ED
MVNRVFRIIIFLSILSGITYLVYTNYNQDSGGQVVTIYHDQLPTKVKPQDSGGIVVPNANNIIYENLQQKKVSKAIILQPEPEKPLNITKQQSVQSNEDIDSIDTILFDIIETDQVRYEKHKLSKNEEGTEIILPNIIKNEPVQKENLIEQQTVPVAPQPNSNKVGLNIIKVTEPRRKIDDTQLLNKSNQGGYKIQIASVKSESEANQEGERIKKKYAKILNNTVINIKKVQSNKGNFFYLVLVGNYQNINQAKAICKKLSDNQQGCIITNR